MPIPVLCDNCQTRLNAPDAAAGKKVKCPKCQAVMAVPAAAAPEPPPVPSRPPAPAAAGTPFDFGAAPPQPSGEPRPATPPEPPAPPPPASAGGAFNFGAAVSSADPARGRGERGRDRADRGERGERERGERGDRERRRRDDDAPPDRGDRPRRPRPRDEDDLEDDDRPRERGGRPNGAKKKSPVVLIGLVAGFLLLTCCGGGAGGVYYVWDQLKTEAKARNDAEEKRLAGEKKLREGGTGPGNVNPGGGKAAVPAGWKAYTPPDRSFKAYFPSAPKQDDPPTPASPKKGVPPPVMRGYVNEGPGAEYIYGAIVIRFDASYPSADRVKTINNMTASFGGDVQGAEVKDITWLGQKGKEITAKEPGGFGEVVIRHVLIDHTAYIGIAGSKASHKVELVNGYFDNFEVLSK